MSGPVFSAVAPAGRRKVAGMPAASLEAQMSAAVARWRGRLMALGCGGRAMGGAGHGTHAADGAYSTGAEAGTTTEGGRIL